jgi:hypothetical protein
MQCIRYNVGWSRYTDSDLCPKLYYLRGDVTSAPLSPHLAPGVRRCSAIALRLGGECVFFGRPPSSLPSLATRFYTGAHQCSQFYEQLCGVFFPKILYLNNGVVSAPFPLHLAPGVRKCSDIFLRLGEGRGGLCFLGDHFRVLSLMTRFYRRHQRAYVLSGGIAANPLPHPLPPSSFLDLADAS